MLQTRAQLLRAGRYSHSGQLAQKSGTVFPSAPTNHAFGSLWLPTFGVQYMFYEGPHLLEGVTLH